MLVVAYLLCDPLQKAALRTRLSVPCPCTVNSKT